MTLLTQNWLNAQASRRYPLDDNATGVGDNGTKLKDDVIADLHLRWPAVAGQYAFIGGITVTGTIVTVVVLGANTTTSATDFTPLASVTIPQPAARHQYYNFEALYPGTGGFIAFGDVDESFNIRFATPAQGLLLPRIARPYAALPVPSLRKHNRVDGLTGLVQILPGNDLEIVKDTVSLNGEPRDALILRLANPTSNARNILSDYIGPCGIRPESQNCNRAGIETINGVGPDCDGNLEIVFEGLTAGPFQSCGSAAAGVTLDQSLGISDVCVSQLPDRFTGDDDCAPSASASSQSSDSLASQSSSSLSSVSSSSSSSSSIACASLPFTDCFDFSIHPSWSLKLGEYVFFEADSPSEPACFDLADCVSLVEVSQSSSSWMSSSSSSCAAPRDRALRLNDSSRRNVLVWEDCGTGESYDKAVTAHVQLTNVGTRQNAGVLLNYHLVAPFTSPRFEYFIAQINRDDNRVELVRFNGAILIVENFATPSVPFSLDDWYQITATAEDQGGGNVMISVEVTNISNLAWPTVSFSLTTSQWGEPDGYYGAHTNRAIANFSFWSLLDA